MQRALQDFDSGQASAKRVVNKRGEAMVTITLFVSSEKDGEDRALVIDEVMFYRMIPLSFRPSDESRWSRRLDLGPGVLLKVALQ